MKFPRKSLLAAAVLVGTMTGAMAADVTMRFHQMLPPQATIPKLAISSWIKDVETDSKGRIKVQQFNTMALGGKPPELFDQAKDGVVDVIWTVLGYTPGRFPKTEVFELPFMTTTPVASSKAIQEYVETTAMDEFKDVHLICVHTHGPGLIHSRDPVTKLEDLKGKKVRGGSRVISIMLSQLGATPVGMPVPAVGEALSKGVLDATTIPYEVVPAVKVQQIVHNHTEFSGPNGLYNSTFGVVMNKASYEKLPADLKKVIDKYSGQNCAERFGGAMETGDKGGKALVQKAGNKIHVLDAAETARWKQAASGTREAWYQEVAAKGIDGKALAAKAEMLINKYSK